MILEHEPAWRQFETALEAFLPHLSKPAAWSLDDLTLREREVLELVAQGLHNGQISVRLNISDKTVRNHVSRVFSKLGVSSRAEAVARARDAGIGSANN